MEQLATGGTVDGPERAAVPPMNWRRIGRLSRWLLLLVAVEPLYVLVANATLYSGVIERVASKRPESFQMGWKRAYSPWPGRVYLSGFHLRLQDSQIQFRLAVDSATVDVDLWALLQRKFRASRVRADGVSYRMLGKVETAEGREPRLAAFPTLEGYPRPALLANPASPAKTAAEVDALWVVELDDVDAVISELWFLEYRYQGLARVHGGFGLRPLRKLWVGPALLVFDGGELSAGEHVISSAFSAHAMVTIDPVDLPSSPGLRALHTLATSIQLDTAIEDLGVADLYLDGLKARGPGRLAANIEVAGGRLLNGSTLEVWLARTDAQIRGYRFKGNAHAKVSVTDAAQAPVGHATLAGALAVPLAEKGALDVELSDVSGRLVLQDNDLTNGLRLERLYAVLGEARVGDARPIARSIGMVGSLLGPVVLGDGPLVASGSALLTSEYALVRLKHLQQGGGELEGAAVLGANGWNGAAAGHFGVIPLGVRVQNSKLETVLLAQQPWLSEELLKAGITPERPALSRADGSVAHRRGPR